MKEVLEKTAVTTELGYPGNKFVRRSKYKVIIFNKNFKIIKWFLHYLFHNSQQTFGLFYCPDGFRPLRSDKDGFVSWSKKPVNKTELYDYDYKESYWVIDEDIYNKEEMGQCTISFFESDKRNLKKVNCTEWHFYLCVRHDRRPQRKIAEKVNESPPSKSAINCNE